jgi:hypothetical protein
MKTIAAIVFGITICASAAAQDVRPYKEGMVTSVSFIRTKPGKFDDYMKYIQGPYKTLLEAEKKAGLIVEHHVYAAYPKNPHEPDIILTITYANMAALDRSDEGDAVASKVAGSLATQSKGMADREALREILGGELVRELVAR